MKIYPKFPELSKWVGKFLRRYDMFDPDFICTIEDIGVSEDQLSLVTEKVVLTRDLDIGFVVQHMSARFVARQPVRATVHATVGIEIYSGALYYMRSDIQRLVIDFADGSSRAYTRCHIERSCGLEDITFEFYDELADLSVAVVQHDWLEEKLDELCDRDEWGDW
jgi:hypothetical protein